MQDRVLPPEAETVESLLNIASILALVFGILLIIYGTIMLSVVMIFRTIIIMLSIAPVLSLTFGIVDIVAFTQIKTIKQLVENSKYREAKDKTLLWSIITLVLGGVIVGILLIVAYIKYDELLRSTESMI